MEMVVDESKQGAEVAPPTVSETSNVLPHDGEFRRVSGSPPTQDFLVSEAENDEEDENNSIAAPVSEVAPQEDANNEEEEEDDYEYEYEDDDDAAFSGFLVSSPAQHLVPETAAASSAPARIEEEEVEAAAKPKWKEPSRDAVDMSLRAEREKTGGKRRLARDLYRIMSSDTEEAGFSLSPKAEDSMDKWIIKLFKFDKDSNLHKDMLVLGLDHVELEMSFPDQYPFEPPFVRVVQPRFKRQTGFVMNGALCMELLTTDGWNPVNDIESVIVSIRSLLVVGDARLAAAAEMSDEKREALLAEAEKGENDDDDDKTIKRERSASNVGEESKKPKVSRAHAGGYSADEAKAAYSHLSDYHKKKGWDTSGWWARKG